MNLRTFFVVGLALLCGLSAAAGVNSLRQRGAEQKALDTEQIVVAAVDIPRGVTVTEDLLAMKPWPKKLVPPGSMRTNAEAVDRATMGALIKDEPIVDRKLSSRDGGRGLAALISDGMRAFTINTPTAYAGVAGFILPGNHVDVLLTITDRSLNDKTGGGTTTTLLQSVEILAVDQKLDAPHENRVDPKEMSSVTLLVTPDQATKLGLAQQKGMLHLSLRNASDKVAAITAPVTLNDLRYDQEEPGEGEAPVQSAAVAAPSSRPQVLRIRTIRGRSSGLVPLHANAIN